MRHPPSDTPAQRAVSTVSDGLDRATVLMGGAADRAAIAEASGAIRGLITAGVRHLVVDVSHAHDVDGLLLTMLARTRAHLNAGADTATGPIGSLTVSGVVLPQFLPALMHAGLDEVFVIYDAVRNDTEPRDPTPAHTTPPRRTPRRSWLHRDPVSFPGPADHEPDRSASLEPPATHV